MTQKHPLKAILALGLLLGLGIVAFVFAQVYSSIAAGAPVNDFQRGVKWYPDGMYVGTTQQFGVDSNGVVINTGATSTVNGVQEVYYRASSMTAATTTLCSFYVQATSTIESYSANITAGTTTASTLTLATSTSFAASSSPIASKTVAANGQATFDWHPASLNSQVFPGTYVNLTQAGNVGGTTFSNSGTCNMVIRSVN